MGVDYESAFSLRSQALTRRVRRAARTVRGEVETGGAAAWEAGEDTVVGLARKAK